MSETNGAGARITQPHTAGPWTYGTLQSLFSDYFGDRLSHEQIDRLTHDVLDGIADKHRRQGGGPAAIE